MTSFLSTISYFHKWLDCRSNAAHIAAIFAIICYKHTREEKKNNTEENLPHTNMFMFMYVVHAETETEKSRRTLIKWMNAVADADGKWHTYFRHIFCVISLPIFRSSVSFTLSFSLSRTLFLTSSLNLISSRKWQSANQNNNKKKPFERFVFAIFSNATEQKVRRENV